MEVSKNEKFVHVRTFIFSLIILVIAEAIGVYLFNNYFNSPGKIVFVRSDYLLTNYQGTKEARVKFNQQKETLQSNLDTLTSNFQRSLSTYNAQANGLTKQAKMEWENRLSMQEGQINQYAQAVENQVQQEDEKMVRSILNQINSFAAEYAKKNKYTLILSTSQGSGGVLYGLESVDVTENLLAELNQNYKGE